jgi:hypothetical protein
MFNWLRRNGKPSKGGATPGPEVWLSDVTASISDNAIIYQSWIWSHTGKLVQSVKSDRYDLVDMGLFRDPDDKEIRRCLMQYAATNGSAFRRLITERIKPFHGAKALLVTMDWVPAIRHIVYEAAGLGIPTILLPHESVFADRERYYTHQKQKINTPACDLVLAWGDLQEEIFVSRGYPADRIVKIGAPKFDYIHAIRGLGRDPVAILGLDPGRPVVTFAAQPLDSQYDAKIARQAQNHAIDNLIASATSIGYQVVVRLPPSKDRLLNVHLEAVIATMDNVAIDDPAVGYKLTAEEAVQVSDIMVSVNSTMLLEAALAGRVAISTKYVEFDQMWGNLNIEVARNAMELQDAMSRANRDPASIVASYDIRWAERALNNGPFDGNAAKRVSAILADICAGDYPIMPGYALSVPFENASFRAKP